MENTMTKNAPRDQKRRPLKSRKYYALLFIGAALVSGCQVNGTTNIAEGIGFRQARFVEVQAMNDYRACRDEALIMSRSYQASDGYGRHLASARVMESCETNLGPEIAGIATEERMQAYSTVVHSYIRGGDIVAARKALDRFKQAFPSRDLILENGSSFIDTYELLLNMSTSSKYQISVANINPDIRDEARRFQFWRSN